MARTEEQFERFVESTTSQLQRLIRPAPPLDLTHAALLVIDMQNGFVHPDGQMYLPGSRHIIKRIRRLLELFRARQRPVIFTRHEHEPDNSDTGAMDIWWSGSHIYKNTWPAEISEKLQPSDTDSIISKNRYSAFLNTNLDEVLAAADVRQVVISGVMTNLCCETTARDAFMRDYLVWFCIDGTATATEEMHLASLRNLAYGFSYLVTVDEILRQFA